MKLTILGNNSAIPSHGRHPTAQILSIANELFLIDCGEGTQSRLSELEIKRSKITRIFISHLHGDHYFGLMGLLTSMSLGGRKQQIKLYGPPQLIDIINLQLKVADSTLCFPLTFIPLNTTTSETIAEELFIKITSFATDHRIKCHGFKFEEIDPYHHLKSEEIARYDIPNEMRRDIVLGQDFTLEDGTIIANETLTNPANATKSYCYCADTRLTHIFEGTIANCDALYHETTYLKEHEDLAILRYHSTSQQAAGLAKKIGAKQLLIGHFSSKYGDLNPFLEECSAIFPNTHLAFEGSTFEI